MPSPFPGMDPWLEHPALWPDVHQSLITYTRDALQTSVAPAYFVSIGERVYLEPVERSIYPDVAVVESPRPTRSRASGTALAADPELVIHLPAIERREPFLEIRDVRAGKRIVTVIEVLSPANKRPGVGQKQYLAKQTEVLESDANLIEIDLLRGGEPTVSLPLGVAPPSAYRVVVSRAKNRLVRGVYGFGLRDRLPRVAVPLAEPDPDAVLDLPTVFAEAYEKGAYARRVDHRDEPVPPLGADDLAWARTLAR